MNEEQKAAWDKLKKLIETCSPSGIHGQRVQEIKDAATAFDFSIAEEGE